MENLKSDKPIVAIETVPECSPFYEDLRSRNHLLGETKRKLAIRLYKECGLQIDWSTFQARRGLQTCWFTSEVCRWDWTTNTPLYYDKFKFHRPLREYLKKSNQLSHTADDGAWAILINGDL